MTQEQIEELRAHLTDLVKRAREEARRSRRVPHWNGRLICVDMYDAKLIELGEPADRVNNAVHAQGKANARSDLRALARACSDEGGNNV